MGDDLKAMPDLDLSVYTNLASAFRTAADAIWGQNERRKGEVVAAVTQWTGATQEAYIGRFEQGFKDGAEICGALYQAAALVDGNVTSVPAAFQEGFAKLGTSGIGEKNLLAAAKRENQRRKAAREWLQRQEHYRNNDSAWDSFNDLIGNDPDWESIPEIGPMPEKVEEPFLQAQPANIEA